MINGILKKILLLFMSFMFVMFLAACSERKDKFIIDFIINGKSHLV